MTYSIAVYSLDHDLWYIHPVTYESIPDLFSTKLFNKSLPIATWMYQNRRAAVRMFPAIFIPLAIHGS